MLDPCPQISVAFLISEIPTSNGPLATPRINICSVIYQQSSRDITASWPREWAVHHHKFPGSLGRGRGLNRQVTTGGSTQMGNCTLPPTDPTWVLGHNYGLGVFHSETWELRSERHVGPGKTVCKLRLGSEENLLPSPADLPCVGKPIRSGAQRRDQSSQQRGICPQSTESEEKNSRGVHSFPACVSHCSQIPLAFCFGSHLCHQIC